MKLIRSNPRWSSSFSLFSCTLKRELQRSSRQSAFTMVEIAIALAVIGFALVAIIGVLPIGLNVQQQNREETIINQDASIFVNAIRSGDRGLDFLTNYVVTITNTVQFFGIDKSGFPWVTNALSGSTHWYALADSSLGASFYLNNGKRIVGLLSKPTYLVTANGFESNYVVAYFRAMSGAAADKYPQADGDLLNLALQYRLVPELSPLPSAERTEFTSTFDANLHELRLRFSWPVLPNGQIGNGRQTFRTMTGGSFVRTNDIAFTNLHFLQKSTFVTAQ